MCPKFHGDMTKIKREEKKWINLITEQHIFTPKVLHKKSRIRETKHLSTDADSSTDTTVGWTKNTQKPIFFEKRKKSSKMQKLKKI